ncbi:methyltransferase domain-containing protein [Streptomyces sp. TRM72054]|uniref:class I SAM-dependent methyltransferase n=1 Tax=Streptomyces sp. TRM72054 TaxID=2870562 RepID=UPI001C8CC1B4|nr:methyltransferase domain-containing protein [Streptomyces sp. TRM72054]
MTVHNADSAAGQKHSSRDPGLLFAHDGDEEAARLAALAQVCDPVTERLLNRLALRPDARCLEIGAGIGTVVPMLLDRCPDGSVVATDRETRLLEHIGHPQVQVCRQDVRVDDPPGGPFDVIHVRNLLCHLKDRHQVLQRVVSWLRPGGVLLVEDPSVFPIVSSPDPRYRTLVRIVVETVSAALGSDLEGWARSFPGPLTDSGLTGIGVHTECPMVAPGTPMADVWRMTAHQLRPVIAARGAAVTADLSKSLACLTDPGFTDFGWALVGAWGARNR